MAPRAHPRAVSLSHRTRQFEGSRHYQSAVIIDGNLGQEAADASQVVAAASSVVSPPTGTKVDWRVIGARPMASAGNLGTTMLRK